MLRLDELKPAPLTESVHWYALRRLFGIEAFGINAFVAVALDDKLIVPHSELGGNPPRAHEEIYFVAKGKARFIVDGISYEASEGTFVHVGDPSLERSAAALEAPTVILAVGGKPGSAFQPSAWEFSGAATACYRERDYQQAAGITREGLKLYPDDALLHYNLACYEALAGNTHEAVLELGRAVELDEALLTLAASDPDLELVRRSCDFPRVT